MNITLRILFRPLPDQLPRIYTILGVDYDERVLPSITAEVLKAVVAQFDAGELITQREVGYIKTFILTFCITPGPVMGQWTFGFCLVNENRDQRLEKYSRWLIQSGSNKYMSMPILMECMGLRLGSLALK